MSRAGKSNLSELEVLKIEQRLVENTYLTQLDIAKISRRSASVVYVINKARGIRRYIRRGHALVFTLPDGRVIDRNPTIEDFLIRSGGHLIWNKDADKSNRCRFKRDGQSKDIHIWLWEKKRGVVPNGFELTKTCSVAGCVAPKCYRLATRAFIVRRACAKLTARQVRSIRQSSKRASALAKQYKVSSKQIRRIRNREHWANVA